MQSRRAPYAHAELTRVPFRADGVRNHLRRRAGCWIVLRSAVPDTDAGTTRVPGAHHQRLPKAIARPVDRASPEEPDCGAFLAELTTFRHKAQRAAIGVDRQHSGKGRDYRPGHTSIVGAGWLIVNSISYIFLHLIYRGSCRERGRRKHQF